MGCDGNGVGGAMELLKAFKSPFSSRVGKKIFCPPILRFYFDLIFSASPSAGNAQPSVSVLDATDRERTQRIVASFIINLFKSLSESAQDFDSQQPFTRSPPFAPPLIRCARQGQAAAAARRLCAHVALVRSLT